MAKHNIFKHFRIKLISKFLDTGKSWFPMDFYPVYESRNLLLSTEDHVHDVTRQR